MVKVTLSAAIDWDNDLAFTGTGEDVTARVLNEPGVTWERGRDQIRALAPPMAGAASFSLNNVSKDYSPANTGGPLYGNLVPGRAVRIQLDGSDMWRGNVDDLPQDPWLRGGGRVQVPALGKLAQLKGTLVSSHLYTNITTDVAFGHVCRLAGLPLTTDHQILDTGKTTLTLWWAAQDDAFTMLTRILAAEGPGAAIYESASGVIMFHSRHYRLLTARCTTSQATFGNGTTEPKHSPPFGYQPNLKGVVNSCTIDAKIGTLAAAATQVATWTGSLVIPWNESRSIWFTLSAPAEQFTAAFVYTPADGGFVYSVKSGGDGAVAATGARVEVIISASNTEGLAITITSLILSAKVYSSVTETVANTVDASASIAKYKNRVLPSGYSPWPYIAPLVARDFCNAIVNAYMEPRAALTVTVKNHNATRVTQQLARDISDRITVQESQTGISGPAFIERIRHTVTAGGRFYTTEFGCEIMGTQANYLQFGVGAFNTGQFGF